MAYYRVKIIKQIQYGAQDGVQNGSPKPDFSYRATIDQIIAPLKYILIKIMPKTVIGHI